MTKRKSATSHVGHYRTYETPEVWRPVVGRVLGFPYDISSWGRIRTRSTYHKRQPRILKPRVSHDGYLYAKLSCGGPVYCKVHILVAEAFIGLRSGGCVVNHMDGDKQNNRPENLEWITSLENERHASVNGLKAMGERHHEAKLTSLAVKAIREFHAQLPNCEALSVVFGVSPETVRCIVKRKSWRHVE